MWKVRMFGSGKCYFGQSDLCELFSIGFVSFIYTLMRWANLVVYFDAAKKEQKE